MDNQHIYWTRLRSYFLVFDASLSLIMALIVCTGVINMASAGMDVSGGRLTGHMTYLVLAFFVMWIVANIPPANLMRIALPMYTLGVALLIAVALFGVSKKGAQRWLNVGYQIQPSEVFKIALPMMLAWYFQKREGGLRWRDFLVAAIIVAIPVLLIKRQPDLGTAILVAAIGFSVIFLAGLSWRLIGISSLVVVICLPITWQRMEQYQRDRVETFLDPSKDKLGKGFHIIQSTIAVGSGGFTGKGWQKGTQAHLEFIPEHHTDFVSAVYLEEWGFLGSCFLVFLYFMLVVRGLMIAANAPTMFTRLMAGAVTMTFFTYSFVNLGMVSGILPVVGVPLPFMSYGGTAMLSLGMGLGILMSVQHHRKLIKS